MRAQSAGNSGGSAGEWRHRVVCTFVFGAPSENGCTNGLRLVHSARWHDAHGLRLAHTAKKKTVLTVKPVSCTSGSTGRAGKHAPEAKIGGSPPPHRSKSRMVYKTGAETFRSKSRKPF